MDEPSKDVSGKPAASPGVFFEHNIGVARPGSRHGQALFIDCVEGCLDGPYTDDDVDDFCRTGLAVRFVAEDGRTLPASEIGENCAINLFMGGAAEVEDPVVNGDEARTLGAVSPIMAILLGAPTTPGVVDFLSAGRLWALTGYALRKEYLYDRDPEIDAKRLFAAALAAESGHGAVDPGLIQGPDGERKGPPVRR